MPLLRIDEDLRSAVGSVDAVLAERFLLVRRVQVGESAWHPVRDSCGGLAIVVSGVLVQQTRIADRTTAQLHGPGTVVGPDLDGGTLPCNTEWLNIGPTEVGVLGDRFAAAAQRWPGLWRVIVERQRQQLHTTSRWLAMASLARVEDRVLALFWLLADSWGVARADGVLIDLPLKHEFIGRLAAAQRPTVSLALRSLSEKGLLTSSGTGDWLLAHGSHEQLAG